MYLDHFNLKTKPFALSTDPRFLWAGANQRQALATLSYGLQENRGIVVLSGEFGTGKTTLVNAFVQGLDDTVRVVRLPEPGSDPAHFRQMVVEGFGLQIENPDLGELMEALSRSATEERHYPQRFLLVIDEAHELTPKMQEDVFRLACRENEKRRILHILLVGQNEIYHWAAGKTREALLNQVAATCRLYPLNAGEIAPYIDLRLRVAGAVQPIFEEEAIRAIHSFSLGVPRGINLVCDFVLLQAYSNGAAKIDAEMVDLCKDRFQIAILDNGGRPATRVRDLTTLPSGREAKNQNKLLRGIGLLVPLLLLCVVVGFWYNRPSNNTPLPQDSVQSTTPPAATSAPAPPLKPASYPAPMERPSPTKTTQKAATVPLVKQAPKSRQQEPMEEQRPPAARTASPPPDAFQAGDADADQTTAETQTPKAEAHVTPTIAAPPESWSLPLRRNADDKKDRPSALPNAPDAKTPSGTDPGDIIDWLIQEKQKGGKTVAQPSNENPPSGE